MNIGIMINIIKEQIGGVEEGGLTPKWLDAKCIILIIVTLGLVLFYGRESIKNIFGIIGNLGNIFKTIGESFKLSANMALDNKQVNCTKTNIKDNCQKPDKEANKAKKKRGVNDMIIKIVQLKNLL